MDKGESMTETVLQPIDILKRRNKQRDRAGRLWPRHIMPVIEDGRKIGKIRNGLAALIEQIKELGPAATFIDCAGIIESMEKAKKQCLKGLPAFICPVCKGTQGIICRTCRSGGWVTAQIQEASGMPIVESE